MARSLVALAAGSLAMALPLVLLFAHAFGDAEPGTVPSGRFLALIVALGLASAAFGGLAAARSAERRRAAVEPRPWRD